MTAKQHVAVAAGFLGVCSVGLLTHGVTLTVPNRLGAALTGDGAAVHADLERRESVVPAGRPQDSDLWKAHVRIVETELAAGRIDASVRAWHDAYGAALQSRSWEGMIDVGDAFMKIGHAAGTPWGARMNARDAYLTALIRARRDRSVDGALRSAQAFAALGDRAIVEQSFYIAAQLAEGDAQAQQRVSDARLRWAGPQNVAAFE